MRDSLHNSIQLKIHILENLIQAFRFANLINYAKQRLSVNSKNTSTLVYLNTSLTSQKFVDSIENLIRFESFQIHILKCDNVMKRRIEFKNVENILNIRMNKQNQIKIEISNFNEYLNTFRACSSFELMLQVKYGSHLLAEATSSISTLLNIQIENLNAFTLSKSLSNLKHVYKLNDTSTASISLYDLIQFNPYESGIEFRAFTLSPNVLDFHLNTNNGILLVNFKRKEAVTARFEIVGFRLSRDEEGEFIFLKKFFINISDRVHFLTDYVQLKLIDSLDLKQILNTNNLASNVSFKLETNENSLFVLDKYGQFNLKAKSFLFYSSFCRFVNVSVCVSNNRICDSIQILVDVKHSTPIQWYPQTMRINMLKNSNSFLTKLSSNSNYSMFYSSPSSSSLIDINQLNGVVTLKTNHSYQNENITIRGNKYELNIELEIENEIDPIKARSNLRLDFYLNRNQLNFGGIIFLGNLGPLVTKRIECNLWNFYDDDSYFLAKNCDLFLRLSSKFEFKQTNLQLRVNYPYTHDYVYYNVEINVNQLIITEQTQMFLVELTRYNSQIVNDVFNYLRINLNSYLIDARADTNIFTILTQSNLEMLQMKLRQMETDLKLNILSVRNELIDEDDDDVFISTPSQLVNTNDFILSCVYGLKLVHVNAAKNFVEFERLNFLKYEALNLAEEKFLKFKYSFKFLKDEANFLFQTSVTWNNLTILLSSHIDNELKFQLEQNLTNELISFDLRLETNVWYEVQIQMFNCKLDIGLNRKEINPTQYLSSINVRQCQIDEFFEVNYLFIGGLDGEHARTSEYFFADNIFMDEFKVNYNDMLNVHDKAKGIKFFRTNENVDECSYSASCEEEGKNNKGIKEFSTYFGKDTKKQRRFYRPKKISVLCIDFSILKLKGCKICGLNPLIKLEIIELVNENIFVINQICCVCF